MSYSAGVSAALITHATMEVAKMNLFQSLAVVAFGGLLLAGCNPSQDDATTTEDESAAPAAPAEAPPAPDTTETMPGSEMPASPTDTAPGQTPPPDTTSPTEPEPPPPSNPRWRS